MKNKNIKKIDPAHYPYYLTCNYYQNIPRHLKAAKSFKTYP